MVCDRCGETSRTYFIFYEIDSKENYHKFGAFCRQCTIELIDELKGKLEWFRISEGWRGYIQRKTRSELEKRGFIHKKYGTQYVEIKKHEGDSGLMKENKLDVLRIAYAAGLISRQEYWKRLYASDYNP